ncbi:hypothetical protein [Rhizobium leguminosarum]|uniref:hypothetical protein n=1 Tax=Rhizobium leguminosarum TaxID=384 RepID=UPI0013EEA599|nr:hypothetical protein [Rhizobium leguminosarum]NZD53360.1 hypothetical protein [Rhizobium leguminosarum]
MASAGAGAAAVSAFIEFRNINLSRLFNTLHHHSSVLFHAILKCATANLFMRAAAAHPFRRQAQDLAILPSFF